MPRCLSAVMILLAGCAPRGEPLPASAAPIERLYRSGLGFDQFLADATEYAEEWRRNYEAARPDPVAVAGVRALQGTWRLLVVAEDWCTDALNTLPYIARLADASSGRLELRIVDAEQGAAITEAHRSFDGRAATPTLVLLDPAWRERGCWVERPHALGLWARDNKPKLSEEDYKAQKAARYAADAGASTLRELMEMIAMAGPNLPCLGNAY